MPRAKTAKPGRHAAPRTRHPTVRNLIRNLGLQCHDLPAANLNAACGGPLDWSFRFGRAYRVKNKEEAGASDTIRTCDLCRRRTTPKRLGWSARRQFAFHESFDGIAGGDRPLAEQAFVRGETPFPDRSSNGGFWFRGAKCFIFQRGLTDTLSASA
jgi:hypothetical protein